MKDLIRFFALFMLVSGMNLYSNAQCTILPYTAPGLYPTPLEGIHPAAAGDPYSLNVTVVIPKDTMIMTFPVPIDSATYQTFIGFPASFQYDYNTPSHWVKGDSSGCILIYGTPTSADVGIHNISIAFTAIISGFPYSDTIDNYWQFEIKDSTHIALPETDPSVEEVLIYPNPAESFIQLTASYVSRADIMIWNTAGWQLMQFKEPLQPGEVLRIPVQSLAPGLYFLQISDHTGNHLHKIQIIR